MSPQDASAIFNAHDIGDIVYSEEERELLAKQNPRLLAAYDALEELAQEQNDDH
jgi:hypothetical protein